MLRTAKLLRGATAADRAAFAAKSKSISPYDLIDAIRGKKVKLEDLKFADLPDKMRNLRSLLERQKFLQKVAAKREDLEKQALDLEKKRAAYLAKGKADSKDDFDTQVLQMLRKQAKKFDIEY